MSVQEDNIIVEIGDSSIAKLAKALGGGSGGGSEGGKKGVGGIAGMLQKITGGFAGGLAKVALITTGITGIFGLVKTIVGASPMLKQILKLFNFGIMLILRPIGDFIGFFFRPIIVMLLRNLIIPFYKDILPRAQELGAFLGGGVAAFFEEPAKFIAEGLSGIEIDTSALKEKLDDFFTGAVNLGSAISNWFKDTLYDLNYSFTILGYLIASWFNKSINNLSKNFSFMFTSISNWFYNGLEGITAEWTKIFDWVGNWIYNGLTDMAADWTKIFEWVGGWIYNGIQSISATWSDIWGWIKDWFFNGLNSIFGGGNVSQNYNGGMINEPIFGIGKSGQAYTFGEKGSELVTPLGGGGGGTTVNITVGSISSESDMREFERRVLDVIENANSRRGRL